MKRKSLDRILDIGTMPNREVKGTELEKEYDALQKELGYAVIEAYRKTGLMP
ncbi:MAG: hypothetical protein ABSC19_11300 [Syntrophorhabdales bacterium]